MNNQLMIETTNLRTYALPPTDNSLGELQNAIDIADYLDIPGGFSYRTYLNNLANNLRDNKRNMNLVREFIVASVISFNNITTTALDNIKTINVVDLKRRNNVFK